jgi:uncharacterized protein (DUF3820 family)
MTTMPFGKHKGLPFEEVPTSYLQWVLTGKLRSPFGKQVRAAVESELQRRGQPLVNPWKRKENFLPGLADAGLAQ